MARILLVDDQESKVDKLQELVSKLDPLGHNHTLITPITPRESGNIDHDDHVTVLDFLNRTGIKNIDIIFQDINLGRGFEGKELIPEYRARGYRGPIIAYTATKFESLAIYELTEKGHQAQGFTSTFPWGDKLEAEQIEFMRDLLG